VTGADVEKALGSCCCCCSCTRPDWHWRTADESHCLHDMIVLVAVGWWCPPALPSSHVVVELARDQCDRLMGRWDLARRASGRKAEYSSLAFPDWLALNNLGVVAWRSRLWGFRLGCRVCGSEFEVGPRFFPSKISGFNRHQGACTTHHHLTYFDPVQEREPEQRSIKRPLAFTPLDTRRTAHRAAKMPRKLKFHEQKLLKK
jgi:hypothetical protein